MRRKPSLYLTEKGPKIQCVTNALIYRNSGEVVFFCDFWVEFCLGSHNCGPKWAKRQKSAILLLLGLPALGHSVRFRSIPLKHVEKTEVCPKIARLLRVFCAPIPFDSVRFCSTRLVGTDLCMVAKKAGKLPKKKDFCTFSAFRTQILTKS